MKSEKLLNAIGKINDKLIEDALAPPEKSFDGSKMFSKNINNKWFRRIAIAACFCMIVSVPVLAIEHGLRVKLMESQHKWDVNTQGRFPMKAFSEEVLEIVEALGTEDGKYTMDNFEEAEAFLGIPLPENVLLENLPQELIEQTWSDGTQVSGNTITHLINSIQSGFVAAWVYSDYRYMGMEVNVSYKIVTELNPYVNGGGVSVEIIGGESEQILETYVTASGRECSIIYSGHGEYAFAAYAYMDIDGILTEVQVRHGSLESIEKVVKEVMDAYK